MAKKNDPSHTEAKKYLDTYTGKIREKFLDQKKEKDLLKILKISPEKQEEEKRKMKEEIKKFVQELQSDKNYTAMKKIYHDQMKNIHEFNKLIHDYTQELEKLDMGKHTKLAKKKFFNENVEVGKNFIKKFKKTWDGLSSKQKQTTFNEIDKLMNDKSAFKKFVEENKKAIINRSMGTGTLVLTGFMSWETYFAAHNDYMALLAGCTTLDIVFPIMIFFLWGHLLWGDEI